MRDHPAVEARGLVKAYGGQRALDGIDLTVRRGQVYGFLGPNGAGKTTTIRILATLARPDGGTARVLGYDVVTEADAIRERVAVTGQFASLDEDLTGYENLLILGRLHGMSRGARRDRADGLLAAFDLTRSAADRPVSGYSGGMRRRLDIAAGLITTPDLLFLDEPTTGLDPRSRNQVWEVVRRVAAAGTAVLLTTQYLEEADRLAERIAVVDHGRIVAEGTSAQLKSRVGANTLHLRLLDREQRPQARRILSEVLAGTVQFDADPLVLSVFLATPTEGAGADDATEVGRQVGSAMTRLADTGVGVSDFHLGRPSLDEAFLMLTDRHGGPDPAEERTRTHEHGHPR
ncbi:daunorubicin resistance protein DrrA family ABC transporter ATP-binding protein [Yinghuangia aomiensis]|uniref:Daunorubicin resistance protein DrrA family ABC transporter ATP-binding protein n=1 Tax=Yinghuangia aomiensis TaxID=676205 RepID=A0ABP9H603_9ACTN